ncbi:ABC transporter ATP-binding protein [Frondihabitans australicus]|uniref:ABC-2 type transport system ATP-binding protein n=1 Tax=Frondihabitans australicus TaxID=386892 RepID=A0A495IGX0_9MICO|nr:ATP-binding cassette domain-containing protein [Frondihabitans australicus]RKR75237.1 ABC-2 type transport system ATP-binding protein [Frondihabitans australicus]
MSEGATASTAVEVADVSKAFGRVHALDGVSFDVGAGEVVGLIGPNGAGKTTLLRILLEVMRPDRGAVRFGGEVRGDGAHLRRQIGYLPGDLRLDPQRRGRAILHDLDALSGGAVATRATRLGALADRLEIDLGRRVGDLSKGNRQKIGLIQAFAHDPALLVLDEPTSGLDPVVQQTFLDVVREARDRGRTVLLSSHDISEIERGADRVVLLRSGRIAADSSVAALRDSAPRRVRVVVQEQADTTRTDTLAPLLALLAPDAKVSSADGSTAIDGVLAGPVADLVRAASALPLVDLVVEEPDLQSVVLGRYARPEAAS